MSRQKAELVGLMIENNLFHAMKEGKPVEVQSTIQQTASFSYIKKIRVLSVEGKILRSSELDERGRSSKISTQNKLRELLSNGTKSNINFIKPESTIQNFRLIENRKECYACHLPQNKINGILEVNVDYAVAATLLKKSQLKGILVGVVSISILIFIILRLFEKLVNRPISRLKNNMKNVQEGDLNIQFPIVKHDEIGSLADSFNAMVKKLREANQKIEHLHNQQMEKAEHLASIGELAAGLAHEIKNPIAGMKGAVEIFNQQTDPSDPKKEIFNEILLQIEKIHRVIQDLLSYAKPKEMNFSLVNPNECIENAIKLARPQTNSKDIIFHFEGIDNNTLARIDADKIQELILNLMLNSISAIEKNGQIDIKLLKKNNKDLEILFSDNGKGIKKEHLAQIFHPFFTTKRRGTGLGLSICQKIINAHNGTIQLKSKEREGTTFFIRLPVLLLGD
jgi:signal transduction histidine kinase